MILNMVGKEKRFWVGMRAGYCCTRGDLVDQMIIHHTYQL